MAAVFSPAVAGVGNRLACSTMNCDSSSLSGRRPPRFAAVISVNALRIRTSGFGSLFGFCSFVAAIAAWGSLSVWGSLSACGSLLASLMPESMTAEYC